MLAFIFFIKKGRNYKIGEILDEAKYERNKIKKLRKRFPKIIGNGLRS